MKLKMVSNFIDKDEYRQRLMIYIDDKRVFHVYDGEPEDATLSRDFSNCFNIVNLMKQAYEAGKRGEELEVEVEEEEY